MSRINRSTIANFAHFQHMSDSEMDLILEDAQSRRTEKNLAIFEAMEHAHSFFFLLDGHVRVVRNTVDGAQVIVRYISPGELFGIAPALGHSTYPATAVAAIDCVYLAWPTAKWHVLSASVPAFAANTFAMVGRRLNETHDQAVALATEKVEQRVATAVLNLAGQSGRKTEDGIEIGFPLTRQDLAEMTGSTLHTVSRLMSGWEAAGLIKSARQKVIVVNPHRLRVIAEGGEA